jgi:hypothetical protein
MNGSGEHLGARNDGASTRSSFQEWEVEDEAEDGLGQGGLRQLRKGGKRSWAAGPNKEGSPFFCKNLFLILFSN